jgi:hypothetical protein
MIFPPQYGAFVMSLDFELHWGVRDHTSADGSYRGNLLGARSAVPRMLALFQQFGMAATWATVGFLFARDRAELTDFFPISRPRYKHSRFDPYREKIGRNETEDPLHFAWSLLQRIRETPRQEIGSHTFSHYFCLEEGQDAESFRADLESARRIASATMGVTLKSLVLPRNQFRQDYAPLIFDAGFLCYRGNQRGVIYKPADTQGGFSALSRAGRLADAYIPVSADSTLSWQDVVTSPPRLYDVRASGFLRPYNPRLQPLDAMVRAFRIKREMRTAARNRQIYHLWWHPHNFGLHINESIEFLSGIFSEFQVLRDKFGFRSMSMAEIADAVGALRSAADLLEVVQQ